MEFVRNMKTIQATVAAHDFGGDKNEVMTVTQLDPAKTVTLTDCHYIENCRYNRLSLYQTRAFAWSFNYGTYVVTDLIASQMMRNLLLATVNRPIRLRSLHRF